MTFRYYFSRLLDSGILDLFDEALVRVARRHCGRDEESTTAIIDCQSVKTTEAVGPGGVYAGKKIQGRKRHIVTDTQGHRLTGIMHETNIQERHGTPALSASHAQASPALLIFSPMTVTRTRIRKEHW
jgi:hypothetical protein